MEWSLRQIRSSTSRRFSRLLDQYCVRGYASATFLSQKLPCWDQMFSFTRDWSVVPGYRTFHLKTHWRVSWDAKLSVPKSRTWNRDNWLTGSTESKDTQREELRSENYVLIMDKIMRSTGWPVNYVGETWWIQDILEFWKAIHFPHPLLCPWGLLPSHDAWLTSQDT